MCGFLEVRRPSSETLIYLTMACQDPMSKTTFFILRRPVVACASAASSGTGGNYSVQCWPHQLASNTELATGGGGGGANRDISNTSRSPSVPHSFLYKLKLFLAIRYSHTNRITRLLHNGPFCGFAQSKTNHLVRPA